MKRILIVVDMQTDFVDGALGTPEAVAILPAVAEKIKAYATDPDGAILVTHLSLGNDRRFQQTAEKSGIALSISTKAIIITANRRNAMALFNQDPLYKILGRKLTDGGKICQKNVFNAAFGKKLQLFFQRCQIRGGRGQ